jgi:nitrogenase subunit NifH
MHFAIVHSKVFDACMDCISYNVDGCVVNDGVNVPLQKIEHVTRAQIGLVVAAYHALAQLYIGMHRCLDESWH